MMNSWPSLTPYSRTIPVPGIRGELFVYDSGEVGHAGRQPAAPLILLHGLGDEADSWRHLFPLLAKNRRVIAADLPGFGRSTAGKRVTLALHRKAVLALLGETGPAILAGSSMGAAVAELAAFCRPDLVRALVFIDGGLPSAGSLSPGLLANLVPFAGERRYRSYRGKDGAAWRSLAPYYADLDALPEADREFLRIRVADRVASETQLRAYFSSFRSFIATASLAPDRIRGKLAALRQPLLLVWGERDMILGGPSKEPLLAARPDARSVVIPGAGHLPHQEKPEETAAALESFFRSEGL